MLILCKQCNIVICKFENNSFSILNMYSNERISNAYFFCKMCNKKFKYKLLKRCIPCSKKRCLEQNIFSIPFGNSKIYFTCKDCLKKCYDTYHIFLNNDDVKKI